MIEFRYAIQPTAPHAWANCLTYAAESQPEALAKLERTLNNHLQVELVSATFMHGKRGWYPHETKAVTMLENRHRVAVVVVSNTGSLTLRLFREAFARLWFNIIRHFPAFLKR